MRGRVILVTGTPGVGKTTLAKRLAQTLNAQYINLTELSHKEHLELRQDSERGTIVIDEVKMRRELRKIIKQTQSDLFIDGHYASAVTPKSLVDRIFVLRRHPSELRSFMLKSGFNQSKQEENLQAEILDVCLVEALQKQERDRVCEMDVTSKPVEAVLKDALDVLAGNKACYVGCVDWMGVLEREGKLDEYLKP